jgi:hypothetical protein
VSSRAALAAVLWLAAAGPAAAYQRDEHYFSTRIALASLRPPLPGADVVAFCGQLADEAPELNAIAIYERLMRHPFDYASWTMRADGPDATVGRMVTVQQLLHSLTGGSASAARTIATATVRASFVEAEREERGGPEKRADALCALGFALHFYGDTYAHKRLKNPRRMYRTGIGHLFDASTPDFPLSAPDRLALWREYVTSLRTLFPAKSVPIDPLLAGAAESSAAARSANAYNRDALIRFETLELVRHGVEAAPIPLNTAKKSCQELSDAYAAAHGWKAAPSCERAWALHRAAAERAFADYDADPAHEGEPSRVDAVRPFYDGSPFDGRRP